MVETKDRKSTQISRNKFSISAKSDFALEGEQRPPQPELGGSLG
jgi:hypothetical protein